MAKNSLNWQNDSVIKAYQQVREKTLGEYTAGLLTKKEAQERVLRINSHIAARYGDVVQKVVNSSADLRGADLSDADLSDADLRGADLSDADLSSAYYQVVRIGSRRGTTTYCVDDDNVLCGCWNNYKGGTLDEFKTRVESVYGREGNNPNEQYYDEYMAAITFFAEMKEIK